MKTLLKIIFPVFVLSLFLASAGIVILLPFVNQENATPTIPPLRSSSHTHALINATIVINTTLSDMPSTMYTLKMVSREWSKGQALEIAEKIFNVLGEAQYFRDHFYGDAWMIKDGIQEVKVYAMGEVRYEGYLQNTSYELGYRLEELPPKESCIAIAEQFIERFSAEGLMPKGLDFSIYYVGPTSTTSVSSRDGTTEEYASDISVLFRPSYGGASLMGERLCVSFGVGGAIIGFSGSFRQVELLEKVSIGSPEWAVERGKEGYGEQIVNLPPGSSLSEVIINSIELVYRPDFESIVSSSEGEIWVPVYRITGVYLAKDGRTGEFAWGVPATLPK